MQYLNNILEQDHRAIKRRVNANERSLIFSVHERFGSALGNRHRRSRLGIRVEFSKDRRILAEMLFQSIDAVLVDVLQLWQAVAGSLKRP